MVGNEISPKFSLGFHRIWRRLKYFDYEDKMNFQITTKYEKKLIFGWLVFCYVSLFVCLFLCYDYCS